MRFEIYIHAKDNEATIRSLHQETSIPGASIKPSKARKAEGGDEVWWMWWTPHLQVNENQVDEAILRLFEQYRPFFSAIRQYGERPEADLVLEVVGFYDENERPCGLYLSAASISLLNGLGCALDYDTVPDAGKES